MTPVFEDLFRGLKKGSQKVTPLFQKFLKTGTPPAQFWSAADPKRAQTIVILNDSRSAPEQTPPKRGVTFSPKAVTTFAILAVLGPFFGPKVGRFWAHSGPKHGLFIVIWAPKRGSFGPTIMQ